MGEAVEERKKPKTSGWMYERKFKTANLMCKARDTSGKEQIAVKQHPKPTECITDQPHMDGGAARIARERKREL